MKKTFLILVVSVLAFVGCKKESDLSGGLEETVADFTMSKTECYVGDEVKFTSTSTNAVSYNWDYDFEYISSEKQFTHKPAKASEGTYTFVSLTSKSKDGLTSYTSKKLTVKNQNEAFKGYLSGDGNSGCEISNLYLDTHLSNQIKFDLGDGYIYAVVNSTVSATLISNNSYYEESDGSTLSITGGSILLNGSTVTLTINFSYYDTYDNSVTSLSCTSVFSK